MQFNNQFNLQSWCARAAGLLLLMVFSQLLQAATITNVFDNGVLQNVQSGISPTFVAGNNMDGMTVTATFSNAFTETLLWSDLTGGFGFAGGVLGSGWSVVVDEPNGLGTGEVGAWRIINDWDGVSLTQLVFDGSTGLGTVFDTTFGGLTGTTNSNGGVDVSVAGHNIFPGFEPDIAAIFSNAVGVAGAAPVGDIYSMLTLQFSGSGTPGDGLPGWNGSSGTYIDLSMDTDRLVLNGDISAVPIPAAVWLFGSGLLALFGIARRKQI